jgi:alcohol dehydrogenase class IV
MPAQVRFGAGCAAELGRIVARMRARRVLLVTGRRSYVDSGAAAALAPALEGLSVTRFHEFDSNPTLAQVERGIALWRECVPDIVVAVGGGSVIDIAKSVNALACQDVAPVELLAAPALFLRPPPPLAALPTTAGTGAEATHFATIYVDGVKHSLAHEALRPAWAIVDPALTATMPPHLTAVTGLDALCQAIESLWATASTGESRALAADAVRCIWPAIADAVHAPTPAVRAAMARGAHLAGCAIDVSKTTAAHAISYALTVRHGVAHGHAVALTLGRFIEHNAAVTAGNVTDPRGTTHVAARVAEICELLGCRSPREARERWYEELRSLSLAPDLAGVGIGSADLDALVAGVNPERLANNPVRVTRAELATILSDCLHA